MSHITSLTYTRGATINTGNYESKRLDLTATLELGEHDSLEAEYERLRSWVTARVKDEAQKKGLFE